MVPSRCPRNRPAWRLVPYVAASGKCEVRDYLEQLKANNFKSFAMFDQALRPRFEMEGPFAVGTPYWEGLGDGLFEISWGRHRIYCSVEDPRRIMMYVAAYKLWRKFKREHKRLCEQRRAEMLSSAYDEEFRELTLRAYQQRREKNGHS